jgi:hypothetical protein
MKYNDNQNSTIMMMKREMILENRGSEKVRKTG